MSVRAWMTLLLGFKALVACGILLAVLTLMLTGDLNYLLALAAFAVAYWALLVAQSAVLNPNGKAH
jgi:hypothetical protein